MSVQDSYTDTPAIAFNGMLAQQFSLRQIDSGIAEGVVILAAAVKPGSADGQFVPAAADDAAYGIAIYSAEQESVDYADKVQFPVLAKGRYYGVANAAVAIGDVIAYDPATGKVGAVSGGVTTLGFGVAKSVAAADGDLVVVECDF